MVQLITWREALLDAATGARDARMLKSPVLSCDFVAYACKSPSGAWPASECVQRRRREVSMKKEVADAGVQGAERYREVKWSHRAAVM